MVLVGLAEAQLTEAETENTPSEICPKKYMYSCYSFRAMYHHLRGNHG